VRLRAGRQRNRASIPGTEFFFFLSKASRPALWPTHSYSVAAAALSFRAGRSGYEADHSTPSGADVRNEWSYTFTSPTHFHGMRRVNLQFVINISCRRSWENAGKVGGRIHRGEITRTIGHDVELFEVGSCKYRNEKTTRRTAHLSGDICLFYCCALFSIHLRQRCWVYFKWAIVSINTSHIP